jgi:hypothetical protein
VLCGNVRDPARLQGQLRTIAEEAGPVWEHLAAIGVAPYVDLGGDPPGLSVDDVLARLRAGVEGLVPWGLLAACVRLARGHRLELVAYEAGFDTSGPASLEAKAAAAVDPRMEALTTDYLAAWFAAGGGQLNWYLLDVARHDSPYGAWGLSDDVRDLDQPRARALREFAV